MLVVLTCSIRMDEVHSHGLWIGDFFESKIEIALKILERSA